jgi:hypothetical protein
MAGPPTVSSIVVTPNPGTVSADESLQFTATAHWSDGTTSDITRGSPDNLWATGWQSTVPAVATVSQGQVAGGLAFGVTAGTTHINAYWSDIAVAGGLIATPGPGEAVPTPTLSALAVGTATLVVIPAAAPPPDPAGRFFLAVDTPALTPSPTWTRIDSYPNLVTSYTIDRGRNYELDRTDTGRATVQIADPDGILDPTNPDSPFWDTDLVMSKIQPLTPAMLGRRNPVTGEWRTRFRGFVEDVTYEFDPSQKVNRATFSLVDLFGPLSSAEMQPGEYGSYPGAGNEGQIFYPAAAHVEDRLTKVLTDFGLARQFWALLPGAVKVRKATYSAGEAPLAALQEAADADFPGANLYCDRRGRLVFHGRLSKFDPAGTAASVGPGVWDYHEWTVGDGTAVNASPTTVVQLRGFGHDRGLSRLLNHATAYPVDTPDNKVAGQLVFDSWSIGRWGVRSWSAPSLLTDGSLADTDGGYAETRRFARYIASNYKWPHSRVTGLVLRPLPPGDVRAPVLWQMLNSVDIGDLVAVNIHSPGGGGFEPSTAKFYVEGVHEDVRPLNPDYDDVTMTFDLSPWSLFEVDPWADDGIIID